MNYQRYLKFFWIALTVTISACQGRPSDKPPIHVNPNMDHFSYIFPCGIRDKGVTSLAKLLGMTVDHNDLRRRIIHHFSDIFDLTATDISLDKVMGY